MESGSIAFLENSAGSSPKRSRLSFAMRGLLAVGLAAGAVYSGD